MSAISRRGFVAAAMAAQVIVSNDVAYVIDCGNGVARQLAFAGVPLTTSAEDAGAAARRHFTGTVIVGRDLLEV